jgi:hypothetical protein
LLLSDTILLVSLFMVKSHAPFVNMLTIDDDIGGRLLCQLGDVDDDRSRWLRQQAPRTTAIAERVRSLHERYVVDDPNPVDRTQLVADVATLARLRADLGAITGHRQWRLRLPALERALAQLQYIANLLSLVHEQHDDLVEACRAAEARRATRQRSPPADSPPPARGRRRVGSLGPSTEDLLSGR